MSDYGIKIKDLRTVPTIDSNDYLVVEKPTGTRKVSGLIFSKVATKDELSNKADISHRHNKNEIDGLDNLEIDLTGYATKDELLTKADKIHSHSEYLTEHQDISHKADKSDIYTKIQTDNKISEEIAKIELCDKHIHSNLSVLNSITQTKVNEWNSKADSNHAHNANDITNLNDYVSNLIENNYLMVSLNETVGKLSSELNQVKAELEEVKNNNNNNVEDTANIYSSLTPVGTNNATKTKTSASFDATGYGWICLDLGDYIGKTLQISADVVMNSYSARYNEIGIHFRKSSIQSEPSTVTLEGSYYCNTIGTYTLSSTISITSNTRYLWIEGCNASYENIIITSNENNNIFYV